MKSRSNNLISVLFAVLICCNSLPVVFGETSGIVSWTVIGISVLLIFLGMMSNNKPTLSILGVIAFICLAHLVSYAFSPSDIGRRYMNLFLLYGALFMLLPVGTVDFQLTIKTIFYFGTLLSPLYLSYNYGYSLTEIEEGYEDGILMTMSYRVLPYICSSFYVFVDKENKLLLRLLSLSVFAVYSFLLIIMGARGAIASILIFVSLCYVVDANTSKKKIKRSIVFIICISLLLILFNPLIISLYNFFESHGINSRSITRIYYAQIFGGDLSAGRNDIYSMAINDFFSSPIWGNGIGSFDSYKGTYPHNIFLQLMVEGGLLFLVPFLIVFFKGIKVIFTLDFNSSYNKMLMLILCSGVVRLFFSSFLWGSHFCWLFVLLVICSKQLIERERNASISDYSHL